jgi:hypothetical protein
MNEWAKRAGAALSETTGVPEGLALEIEVSLAFAELTVADEWQSGWSEAEDRLDLLEQRAAAFDEEIHVNIRCSRIDWLEARDRCPEAAAKLASLDAHVATLGDEFHARVYAQWRAGRPKCPNE